MNNYELLKLSVIEECGKKGHSMEGPSGGKGIPTFKCEKCKKAAYILKSSQTQSASGDALTDICSGASK